MKRATGVLSAAVVCAMLAPAQAQDASLIDGSDFDQILSVAQGYGRAKLTTQTNGDPRISGRNNGISYQVYFMNCTDHADCEDLNFYMGFTDIKPGFEVMNEWNATKRFGKAYIDNVGDAVIEWDVNLEFGLSRDNLDADFSVWTQIMDQFSRYVGFQ